MNKRITAGTGALGALLAAPAAAQAEDFTVTNLNDNGAGSLRQAIDDAIDNDGSDRIVFNSKLSGTINLTDETGGFPALYISYGDLEIVGPGARQLTVRAPSGYPAFVPFATAFGAPAIDVTISGLRITGGNNTSAYLGDENGGGIQSFGEVDLTLSRMSIVGNSASGNGGGVANVTAGEVNDLTIENSTISGNSADDGGGIAFTSDGGELSIRSSTISGNSAGSEGGALYLPISNADTAAILNSTLTGNEAGDTNGGGAIKEDSNGATIRGSIIAGNSDADGATPNLDDGPWATSFSLIGDTTGATDLEDNGGNLLDVDPKLKPLANNGGPTDTHAFKKSPAKNNGPSDAPKSDQRGAPRKGKPDIGAYELVKCEGVVVNRVGTAKKDKLKGTKKKDGILGLGGNDKLSGKKGKDGLCGGKGKDKLKGGPGKDKLDGGPGKDKLDGGPGKDKEVQ
jgi:RTX calcium-binding nonapeptide repeat (4 copies)